MLHPYHVLLHLTVTTRLVATCLCLLHYPVHAHLPLLSTVELWQRQEPGKVSQ